MAQWTRWIPAAGVSLAGTMIIGCGVQRTPTSAPVAAKTTAQASHSSRSPQANSAWRTIQLGDLTLRIPHTWRMGKQITLSWQNSTSGVQELFPDGSPMLNGLPPHPQPYLSKQISTANGQTTFRLAETSSTGQVYDLTVTAQHALVMRVVHSLKLPPPITATALVRQFNAHHSASHGTASAAVSYIRTAAGSSRWLLVFGNPATALEDYLLFHSANGGHQWSLINQTGADKTPAAFPDTVGQPTMDFWTPNDGLLVESSMFYPTELLVYRTTNAGATWSLQRLTLGSHNQIVTGDTHLRLVARHGLLEVSVKLKSGQVFQATSVNDRKTWNTQK